MHWFDQREYVSRIGRGATLLVITVLCIAALIMLALSVFEPDTLLDWTLRMEQDPTRPHFNIQEIVGMQQRAMAVGFCYLTLAAVLIWIGPSPASRIFADVVKSARRLPQISTRHSLWLLATVIVAALFAIHYADQAMRLDEARSFLMYGRGSIFRPIALSYTTNNHILYSLLMNASVKLFGDAEWAIRLPAMIAAVATIPALYLAGRSLFDAQTGLIAAAAAAGSTYTNVLATNARGYALVNLAFLLTLALLPALRSRRLAAWAGFVLLSSLGAWAVPIMLYPFAIAVVWLIIVGLVCPPAIGRIRWLRDVLLAVLATGAVVLLLYSPSLVVIELEELGVRKILAGAQAYTLPIRLETLVWFIQDAWEQWTYPAPRWIALVTLIACGVGVVISLVRGGRARALVIASVIGPLVVLIGTRFAPPPWWTLSFAFPLYLLFIGFAVASLMKAVGSPSHELRRGVVTAATVLAVVSFGTLNASYPNYFPYYSGYRDAKQTADYLSQYDFDGLKVSGFPKAFPRQVQHEDAKHADGDYQNGFDGAWIVTDLRMAPPLNYYLYRRAGDSKNHTWHPTEASPAPTYVFRIVENCRDVESTVASIAKRHGPKHGDIYRLPRSWIVRYGSSLRSIAPLFDGSLFLCREIGQ